MKPQNKKPGGLRPGDSFECTGGYLTTEEDVLAGMISNSVSVSQEYTMEFKLYMQGCGCTPTTEIKSESFSYQSSDVGLDIPFDAKPYISLKKSVTPEFYSGGETVTYVYEITNTGNTPLYEPFYIQDDLVDDVFCPSGFVLQPGQTFPCEATYLIDLGLRWTITNNAQAFTSLDGLSIESNIASASVNYRQPKVVPEKEPIPCPPGVCD